MSQAGILDIEHSNPQIPTSFQTDDGIAIPIANVLEVLGGPGIETEGSGNTITISLTGGGKAIDSLSTDVSGPVIPAANGNVAVTGATNIFSDGSVGNTLQLNLQGTNHALYVGRGSNLASANLAVGTNGQVLIAATGEDPAFATITSTGGTIAFTLGANTLNMEAATGGFTWSDASGAFSPLKENGYFITGTATGTLPASPANGNTIQFYVDHASQVLTIQATAGKIIRFGSTVSAAAGTAVSTAQGDSVELVYRSTNSCWCAVDFNGIWNVT